MKTRSLFWILVAAAALIALLRPGKADAYMPRVCWVYPTKQTNGTTLPITSIQTTEIQYGTCSSTNFGTPIYTFALTGAPKNCTYAPNIQPGLYCYQVRVKANNVWSDWSLSTPNSRILVPAPTCGAGCHEPKWEN